MKTAPIVGAIDGDRLAGSERDGAAKKSVHAANFVVQFGEMKMPVVTDRDFAISFASEQLIDKIGNRDFAVTRELKAAEDIHCAATGLRPQSLATQ
jgi:hypothetical protein